MIIRDESFPPTTSTDTTPLDDDGRTADRRPGEDSLADDVLTDVPQPRIRHGRSFARELIETVLLIVAIYTFVNLATARFVVDGNSMLPNFETDQFIIVSRLSYITGEPKRGDVVVFHYPNDPNRDFIKRIIGLPGETVNIYRGQVYIDGRHLEEPYITDPYRETVCGENYHQEGTCEWHIGPDEYFVLGDNRNHSKDSQDPNGFGPVDRKYLVGRAFVRYWPWKDWGLISHWSFDNNWGAPLPTMTPTPLVSPTPVGTPSMATPPYPYGGYNAPGY